MNRSRRLSNVFFTFLGAAAVGLVIAVLAVTGVLDDLAGENRTVVRTAPAPTATVESSAATSGPGGSSPTDVSDIYARVAPGVAFISATGSAADLPLDPSGGGGQATGSGFLIDGKGHVVTNQHVVDGRRRFTVRFGEDGDALDAELAGQDPSTDLAVLEVDPEDIPAETRPLEFASSAELRPGDAAIAIGSPFGLSGTVTTGIISALDREITSPNGFPIPGVLQTDAAINPGNSGGPLLDAQGRVIGVNSQIASDSRQFSGVGFAVPVDTVKEVVPELIEGGRIDRAYLGVSTTEVAGESGAVVAGLTEGGPAADSDLRVGDRIVAFDGTPVSASSDLSQAVLRKKPGETARIEVVRRGERRTIEVRLGRRPDQLVQG
ncbi:MAG TPA: trypsin-like peptidase domain-containing protein [Solirubrobacteraceae bacterium]|nr:trypsin-like peptidase domain-containing protein [Solirubrobacteraceae bacterium]